MKNIVCFKLSTPENPTFTFAWIQIQVVNVVNWLLTKFTIRLQVHYFEYSFSWSAYLLLVMAYLVYISVASWVTFGTPRHPSPHEPLH